MDNKDYLENELDSIRSLEWLFIRTAHEMIVKECKNRNDKIAEVQKYLNKLEAVAKKKSTTLKELDKKFAPYRKSYEFHQSFVLVLKKAIVLTLSKYINWDTLKNDDRLYTYEHGLIQTGLEPSGVYYAGKQKKDKLLIYCGGRTSFNSTDLRYIDKSLTIPTDIFEKINDDDFIVWIIGQEMVNSYAKT